MRKAHKRRPGSGPGMALNCDVLPPISSALRVSSGNDLRPPLTFEPPEALWPETKGQAASLARVTAILCIVRALTRPMACRKYELADTGRCQAGA